MPILRERKILKNVIEKYRARPVLWDHTHELYGNKIARKDSYDQLLEIYKAADPDATKHELKRKIENMRTSYRRERVKVLKCRANGEKEYVPTLWYYTLFTFLPDIANDGCNNSDLPTQSNVQSEDKEGEEEEEEEIEEENGTEDREEVANCSLKSEFTPDSPPPRKKKKTNQIFFKDVLAVDADPYLISTVNDQCNQTTEEKSSSTESFAKTVGLQLNELESMQKCIAEKLISDVIFYGRLGKLKPIATISMNSDD